MLAAGRGRGGAALWLPASSSRQNHTGRRQEKHLHSKPNSLAAFLSDSQALIRSNSCCRSFVITPLNPSWELTSHSLGRLWVPLAGNATICRGLRASPHAFRCLPECDPASPSLQIHRTWCTLRGAEYMPASPQEDRAPDGRGPVADGTGVNASSPLRPHGDGPSSFGRSFIRSFTPVHTYGAPTTYQALGQALGTRQ